MDLRVTPTRLPGVVVLEPRVFGDARGYFLETYHAERYAKAGIAARFVQDNLSFSERGVLRGLHLQNPYPQAKLVSVLHGEVFDVAVDVRRGSATFGQWVGVTLTGESKRQLYVPEGYAHGFCVTSDSALLAYKCSDYYHPESEVTVLWDDPGIGIPWPVTDALVSEKDKAGRPLNAIEPELLPTL